LKLNERYLPVLESVQASILR